MILVNRDDPLRPIWDPSSVAGRVMIGGDIPVLLSFKTITTIAAATLHSSFSVHAPRWLMCRDGGRDVTHVASSLNYYYYHYAKVGGLLIVVASWHSD